MEILSQKIGSEDDVKMGLAFFFGPFVMDRFLDMALQVDNYFIFNIGRLKFEDIDETLTIGIFNNVIPLVSVKKQNKQEEEE